MISASFTGSLEISSTAPIVTLSLNFEAAPVFSSLPSGEVDAAAQGSTTYYFPHLAVGASWQTTVTYINYSSQEVSCQTEFLSDHGSPLMVSFAGMGTVVSRTDVLPPGGSVHEETNIELSAPLAPGWARATCSEAVKASLLFRQHNSAGAPTGEAAVNAATVPATRFVTFAEQGEGKQGTGVAYANPSDTAAMLTFTAKDEDGETLASVVRTLLPGGHDAQNMALLFGLSSFTGSIEITSTEPIVSLSLNFEAAPVFSSLPSGELNAADIPGVIPMTDAPDLVVQTPSVDDSSPGTGGSFTLSATVSNAGTGESAATTLRYYRSNDATISASDTEVGTDAVEALVASGSNAQSVALRVPSAARTYYYGVCVDAVTGESDTTNNCSGSVQVTVSAAAPPPPAQTSPDLTVGSPSVTDNTPDTGGSFTLSATVSNAGDGGSAATTLRYYRSADATLERGHGGGHGHGGGASDLGEQRADSDFDGAVDGGLTTTGHAWMRWPGSRTRRTTARHR